MPNSAGEGADQSDPAPLDLPYPVQVGGPGEHKIVTVDPEHLRADRVNCHGIVRAEQSAQEAWAADIRTVSLTHDDAVTETQIFRQRGVELCHQLRHPGLMVLQPHSLFDEAYPVFHAARE